MVIPSPNRPQRRAKPMRVVDFWCRCQRSVPEIDMALRALCLVRVPIRHERSPTELIASRQCLAQLMR